MKIVNTLFILFLIFCVTEVNSALLPPYIFKSYQVEDGLSHNTVWCTIQDSFGFVWFGTSDGLNCYTGKSNKVYKNELNNPFSIENNYIQALLEVENGDLWIGTNRGVYIYNRQNDQFSYFEKRTQYGVVISSEIKKIFKAQNGMFWIATMGQGFFIYDPLLDELTQHSIYAASVSDLCQIESGLIYLATLQDGLLCFNEDAELQKRYSLRHNQGGTDDYKINCLLYIEGCIWLGTSGEQLFRLDIEKEKIEHYKILPHTIETVQALMEYDSERILVGTDDGLFGFNYKAGGIARLDNKTISDQSINGLMRDKEGGVWVLTNMGGVNYIPKSTKQFYLFSPLQQDGLSGAGKVTGPFCEDKEGNIWIGTRRGLSLFNTYTYQLEYYTIKYGNERSFDVRSLLIEKDKMWIGTSGSGLLVMNKENGEIKHYTHSQGIPNTICSDDVLALYQTQSGDIYIGTSWGLCRYERENDDFVTIPAVGMMVSVVDIHQDRYGYLWVATSNSGVFRMHPESEQWVHYQHKINDISSVTSNSVVTLFEDSTGEMWFGTDGKGLCSYDREKDCFINFDPENNLIPNGVIYAIEEDLSGDFWISGTRGLIRVNPVEKRSSQTFTVADGLQGNQFNYRSSLRSSNGYLFFGGINGFNMFLPETFTDNTYIPPVYITDINFPYAEEDPVKAEQLLWNTPLYLSKRIVLPYIHNSFSLIFNSLSYEAPDNNKYSWILHGIDKDWIQDTESNMAFYTELPPGKYEFEVRGANNDNIWNEESTWLTIIITPPWWRSTIANIFYILVIIGIIYFLGWQWNRYVKTKYRKRMEDFRMSKEQEIYKSKISFFINLVHEIRTPLSLIKLPLEKLQDEQIPEKGSKYLSVIDKNVNYLLGITNQLLDFQKMESGNLNFQYSACNINQLISSILSQFMASVEMRGLTLSADLPEQELIVAADKDKISKILVNLLSNATKYAQKQISIQVSVSNNNYSISVCDDGPGIPEEEKGRVFDPFYQIEDGQVSKLGTGIGLAFSKSLVNEMGGTLFIEDNPQRGAAFKFVLPIKETEEGVVSDEISNEIIQSDTIIEADNFEFEKRKFTLLFVEDNVELLKLTSEALNEWFRVLKAGNGNEAIEILQKESPDVIVSDIMMEGMDGLELCNRIKTDITYSHIPVILLTAKTNIESKIEGFESGADAYLEKPFSVRQLRRQIENLLKLRLAYHKTLAGLTGSTNVVDVSEGISQKDYELMTRITSAIEEQLSDENFTIDSLAESLHMSRSNFYRKIKALTGMAPNDYLKTVRLNKSVELLKQDIRVSEIYIQVGFSSAAYYAKCFKDKFGVSPKKYIEQQM